MCVAVEGQIIKKLMIRMQITILTPPNYVPVSSQDLDIHRHISWVFLTMTVETFLPCSRTSRPVIVFDVYSPHFIVCVVSIFYCHKNS